jgi:hypothetical protein
MFEGKFSAAESAIETLAPEEDRGGARLALAGSIAKRLSLQEAYLARTASKSVPSSETAT